jgi:hypothetical protein
MATVHLPANLRPFAGDHAQVAAPGATLRQVFEALEHEWPGLTSQIIEDGSVLPQFAIAIDGTVVESGLGAAVGTETEIYLIASIGGGAGQPLNGATRLISFDIDGTLEVGEPPGEVTLDTVRRAHALGIVVGSCSDRPISYQQKLWADHDVPMQFVVLKQNLMDVRASFPDASHYLHIGDTPVDRQMALDADFEFLDVVDGPQARLLAELAGD